VWGLEQTESNLHEVSVATREAIIQNVLGMIFEAFVDYLRCQPNYLEELDVVPAEGMVQQFADTNTVVCKHQSEGCVDLRSLLSLPRDYLAVELA
jgi:hypothetical protein